MNKKILLTCFLFAVLLLVNPPFPAFSMGTDALTGLDDAAVISGNTAAEKTSDTSRASEEQKPQPMGRINDSSGQPPCWWLNLREGPGHRFPVIKVMKGGSILKILGRDAASGWYKVSDGTATGWCGPKYVRADANVPAAGTANPPAEEKPPVVADNGNAGSTGSTGSTGSGDTTTPGQGTTPPATGVDGGGAMNANEFGYDAKRYQPVFDIVQKYVDANEAYKLAAGHTSKDGYASVTDCSGFVGSFYQKLAALSGIPPVFPKNSWYQTSTLYKNNYTRKVSSDFPPPNPRDLIKPGDIFVMDKGSSGYGHVGVFMGYDKSGNPVIAHSTPSRRSSYIYGDTSETGVRVEVLPRSYKDRWAGIYRIDGTDKMLDALSKS
jgi:cell wall-associated NlpC family hydrolase